MAKDIFGTDVLVGGAWKIDGAVLSIEGGNDLVAVRLTINYQRTQAIMRPLNQNKVYLVASDPQNPTIQISTLVAPIGDIKSFIETYANVCNVSKNTLTITPLSHTCDNGVKLPTFKASGCLLSGIAINAQRGMGGDNTVSADVSLAFLSLELT